MMLARLEDDSYVAGWKTNFQTLYRELEERMAGERVMFDRPSLHLKEKGDGSCRSLGTYVRLSDRLLMGLVARHLRALFDGQMCENSYAFRRDREITHVTAIRRLRDYRMLHEGEKLYVAECDIRSFFDVLNHEVVMAAYDSFAAGAEKVPDDFCRNVVKASLESYSSYRNVAEAAELDNRQRNRIAFYKSKELARDLHKVYGKVDLRKLGIGIPQGGPLSPLLINMVLHRADEAVLSGADENLFYARFCDDTVIVHPNRKKCQEALARYLAMLGSLMLPYHPVQKGLRYGREYYAEKSKGPVAWCDCKIGSLRSTPWVSFLGEQIRFDGSLRVRESSIENERRRLFEEKARLVRAVGRDGAYLKSGLDPDKVFDSFRSRLVALGVGYAPQETMGSRDDKCWLAAFPGLSDDRWTRTEMKVLDRTRDRVLGAVGHRCLASKDAESALRRVFMGRPFSYSSFLRHASRPSKYALIDDGRAYGL